MRRGPVGFADPPANPIEDSIDPVHPDVARTKIAGVPSASGEESRHENTKSTGPGPAAGSKATGLNQHANRLQAAHLSASSANGLNAG